MTKHTASATPQTSAIKPAGRLAFADGLRGLAALWVVLFHISEGKHIELLRVVMPDLLHAVIFDWGDLGVAVFFVLSGFVMALTVVKAKADARFAANFMLRRLARLAPPYYAAIVFTLLLLLVKAKTQHTPLAVITLQDLLAHVFFLQGILSIPHINIVYWTLCIEVQFYIAFAIIFWIADQAKHRFNLNQSRLIIVAVASAFALLWAFQFITDPLWTGGFIGFWYCFLAGVLVCLTSCSNSQSRSPAFGYFLLLAIAGIYTHSPFPLAVAITSFMMTIAYTQDKMHQWLNWRWLQSLGLISYSLYLLHNPIIGASFNIFKRVFPQGLFFEIVELFIVLAICLLASWIVYLLVERPSIAWSHSISSGKPQTTSWEPKKAGL